MSTFPDFTKIALGTHTDSDFQAWRARFLAETGRLPEDSLWQTPELLEVKPVT